MYVLSDALMKKGVKRCFSARLVSIEVLSDALMKKGVKQHGLAFQEPDKVLSDALMKKGVKRKREREGERLERAHRYPDEEGSETKSVAGVPPYVGAQRCPDEEGSETSSWRRCSSAMCSAMP